MGFLQFLRGQKELEVIDIKKLFEFKLSMGKRTHPVNWAVLISTTVDTLIYSQMHNFSSCEVCTTRSIVL